MNILPIGPELAERDPNYDQYFADLRRWNFDIAYNAHYAYTLEQTTGAFAAAYRQLAERARTEGVPCCIQIQSTVANSNDVPFSDTQRYTDNQYFCYEHHAGTGKVNHFGSFASTAWLEHQKTLTRTFREFGYDWVVFEEPMLHTDIPGTQDPMYRLFQERYPELPYPTHQAETVSYLQLQALKRDVLVGFFTELTDYARQLGFRKIGLMPWFLTPTLENTPAETWATSCDTGRITFMENLDFIVVRMQPDNIYAQVMIAATGESTPVLSYYECLAHNLGKPIIMVNNPTDEHQPENNRDSTLIPYPFFARYTLAATAAAPQGMSRHWYGKNYGEDDAHMDLMTRTNEILRRLGTAEAAVAFVFSFSGTAHVWPRPWREVWRTYWSFITRVTEECRLSCLTLFAETLGESLARHRHLRVIVLNEFFPLPPQEVELIRGWLSDSPGRHVLYTGGRDGYRWDPAVLHTSHRLLPPEMAALAGADVEKPVEIVYPDPSVEAARVPGIEENDFLPPVIEASASSICRMQWSDDADVEVLYETVEESVPVLARSRTDGGTAWMLPLSLEGNFRFPLRQFLRHLVGCEELEWQIPCAAGATPNVFFNTTSSLYFVVSNCAGTAGRLDLTRSIRCWDVDMGLLHEDLISIELQPLSARLFRLLQPSSRLLDVSGTILLTTVDEAAESIRLVGLFHRELDILLLDTPCRATAGGRELPLTVLQEEAGRIKVRLSDVHLDDEEILLQFG